MNRSHLLTASACVAAFNDLRLAIGVEGPDYDAEGSHLGQFCIFGW